MSHLKEREEKICLNCNAELYGRYCHVCGQENIEPKESVWHLVTHFVYDVMHFDGKFFSSAKYLLFRPGYLSHEYIKGRRASYLNPIRMYVFVSAIFFLFFLSVVKPGDVSYKEGGKNKGKPAKQVIADLEESKQGLEEVVNNPDVPTSAKNATEEKLKKIESDIEKVKKDSTKKAEVGDDDDFDTKYTTVAQYDSAQSALPVVKRDGWLARLMMRRNIQVREQYGDNKEIRNEKLTEKFFHSIPEMLFVTLPVFALILQLLYIRRKNFFYVDHFIYSLHLYCGIFVLAFIIMIIGQVAKIGHMSWFDYLQIPVWLYLIFYTYKSLRNFYEQRRAKTILKWFLLNLCALFVMMILFALYSFFILLTF